MVKQASVEALSGRQTEPVESRSEMDHNEARELVQQIADAMEQNAASLTPDVIRSAKQTEIGAQQLQRMEDAIGTIGKALILTDFKLDQNKDLDKLKGFRSQQS